jgi:hypothetical protein
MTELGSHSFNTILLRGLVALGISCGACGHSHPLRADASADADQSADADACDCPIDQRSDACVTTSSTDASAPTAIPLGVYTQCVSAVREGGQVAMGSGGTVTLAASGGSLTVDVGTGVLAFASGTLTFTPIAPAAAIVSPGQSYGISNVPCTTSTAAAGVLALDGDTLDISLIGEGCQNPISGTIRCTVPAVAQGALEPPSPCSSQSGSCVCGAAGAPAFPVGVYDQCTTSLPAFGGGQITLTQSGGALSAAIAGVTSVAPANATLRFTIASDRTAAIVAGQTWVVSVPGAFSPTVSQTMTITGGTLVDDGSTLFAFIIGTSDAGPLEESLHCTATH